MSFETKAPLETGKLPGKAKRAAVRASGTHVCCWRWHLPLRNRAVIAAWHVAGKPWITGPAHAMAAHGPHIGFLLLPLCLPDFRGWGRGSKKRPHRRWRRSTTSSGSSMHREIMTLRPGWA
jgi:hypothetical protein